MFQPHQMKDTGTLKRIEMLHRLGSGVGADNRNTHRDAPMTQPTKEEIEMENEQPTFPPFQSLNSNPEEPSAPKAKRGRKPKPVKAAKEPPKKRGRKPRVTKLEKQPRGSSLDIKTAITAFAGLKPAECELVGELVLKLQAAPKRSRAKIVEALGKVFT